MRTPMQRIFCIYTEASIAIFMGLAGLVELVCGYCLTGPLQVFAWATSAFFLVLTVKLVAYVCRDAKASGYLK